MRGEVIDELGERGVDVDQLQYACGEPDADPLDLLAHVGWNAELRSRRQRADAALEQLDTAEAELRDDARWVLGEITEKYAEFGVEQFELPDVLQVPPISDKGNVGELAELFGGAAELRSAVERLQVLIYS